MKLAFTKMIKGHMYTMLLFVASFVFGATAVAQTSPSTPAVIGHCSPPVLTKYWHSGNSSNVKQPIFCIISSNGNWLFAFESDGLHLLERDSDGNVLSDTVLVDTTNDPGITLDFIDGNMSIKEGTTILWQTHTLGHPDAFLQLQDNGGVYIYNDSCTKLYFIPFQKTPPDQTCVLPPGD